MLDTPNKGEPSQDELDLELAMISDDKADEAPAERVADIPTKYEGKSIEDLIRMNEDAQREISRKGNEISEVRRLADVLIGVKPEDNSKKQPERKPITVDALLDNPDSVLNSAFESSTVSVQTKQVAEKLDSLEKKIAFGEFTRKYPTYTQDIADPAFAEWAVKSSLRKQLAERANALDFDAANNLWELWTEHQELTGGKEKQDVTKTVKAAATVRNGANKPNAGSPTYSRAKLMELRYKAIDGDQAAQAKLDDPEFNARLVQAYAENRVK